MGRTIEKTRLGKSKIAIRLGFLFSPLNSNTYEPLIHKLKMLDYHVNYYSDWKAIEKDAYLDDIPKLFFVEIEQFLDIDKNKWEYINYYLNRYNIKLIVTGNYFKVGIDNIIDLYTRSIVDILFMPVDNSHLKRLIQLHYH